ncbi:hypothetical protein SLW73_17935 [Glutamicibacter protophormiae]|uniref:hypothetical protein n=1 Tax=Glutamicibacter protophormiae TaxID=37930 RepID=UPI002A8389DC|nr:hypothetical protein [Glutamicibacter protophormiae]WPR64738.1 hypothetical protein SLW72_17940 [Glutamicibacter protophormiae]WPR68234.1 hypothetical protein SLW73_17935 [Glutamicibacter protophormiae]
MKKPYGKFTVAGLTLGSLSTFIPWLVLGVPATLTCQVIGMLTVLAFGLFFVYAAHLSSSPDQKARNRKTSFVKAV